MVVSVVLKVRAASCKIHEQDAWSLGIGNWQLTNEVRYVYDRRLVLQERAGNNLPLVTYTRGNDLSGSLQEAGGISGLLARSEMSNLQLPHAYYHADGNGNITALVNTNALLVARYHYDPFGNTLAAVGPLTEANLYRFSSKEWHPNSGLVYYLYRFYEPSLQRWMNRDPLGDNGGLVRKALLAVYEPEREEFEESEDPLAGWFQLKLDLYTRVQMNLYEMIGNDPLNAFDLFGLASCKIDGERITVHKNDPDPWPSRPHGHIYDKNQVVDVDGRIYNKTTRQPVGKLSRTGLSRWRAFLGRLRGFTAPLLNIIPEVLADVDRAIRAKKAGKTYEQQLKEDLKDFPTIRGLFGEELPNPYYCPMAMNWMHLNQEKSLPQRYHGTQANGLSRQVDLVQQVKPPIDARREANRICLDRSWSRYYGRD